LLQGFGDSGEGLSGGVASFGRRLGVDLRLDGYVGWFIMVALSGFFSGLEQGGREMLGLNS
jgi:hypothetical protein